MNVTEDIIQRAKEDKMMKALAFHYLVKQRYKDSICREYTPKKLCKVTGVSVNTIKKYIAWLLDQKIGYWKGSTYLKEQPLVYFVGKNLHFSRVQPKKHICTIKLNNNTLKEIESLLYGKIIQQQVEIQKRQIKLKSKPGVKNLIRKAQQEGTPTPQPPEVDKRISVSVRTLCKRMEICPSKLRNVSKFLICNGVMKLKKGEKKLLRDKKGKVVKVSSLFYREIISGLKEENKFSFITSYKGMILICKPTNYSFALKRY